MKRLVSVQQSATNFRQFKEYDDDDDDDDLPFSSYLTNTFLTTPTIYGIIALANASDIYKTET